MGLVAREVHDVQRVDDLVAGVDVSLKHDCTLVEELLWVFWVQVMVGGDVGEGVREKTEPYQNVVHEQELGGLGGQVGAEFFVKGGEGPILALDVIDRSFKLGSSIFFAELFGAKLVDLEESVQDFSTRGEVGCIGFAEV